MVDVEYRKKPTCDKERRSIAERKKERLMLLRA
jgi:hypothetical protein